MLHIIFLILKILGLVLLVLIGIILVLTAALLFLPARYTVVVSSAGGKDTLRWRIRFCWLAHLVSGRVSGEKGTQVWRLRVGWKNFRSGSHKDRKDGKEEKNGGTKQKKKKKDNPEEKPSQSKNNQEKTAKQPVLEVEPGGKEKNNSESYKDGKKQTETSDDRAQGFKGTFSGFAEKIKYTFSKIYANIKMISRKKEKIRDFLANEVHRSALVRILSEAKRLLRFLRPKKFAGEIEFGFEDPACTGYVLAAVSMIYPFIGEYTDIRPDFEHKIFKGRILAQGKLRLVHLIIPLWNLYFDKDVKKTYEHVKNFKL